MRLLGGMMFAVLAATVPVAMASLPSSLLVVISVDQLGSAFHDRRLRISTMRSPFLAVSIAVDRLGWIGEDV